MTTYNDGVGEKISSLPATDGKDVCNIYYVHNVKFCFDCQHNKHMLTYCWCNNIQDGEPSLDQHRINVLSRFGTLYLCPHVREPPINSIIYVNPASRCGENVKSHFMFI